MQTHQHIDTHIRKYKHTSTRTHLLLALLPHHGRQVHACGGWIHARRLLRFLLRLLDLLRLLCLLRVLGAQKAWVQLSILTAECLHLGNQHSPLLPPQLHACVYMCLHVLVYVCTYVPACGCVSMLLFW